MASTIKFVEKIGYNSMICCA